MPTAVRTLKSSGTVDTLLSTDLNSLANNALVLGAAVTPTDPNYPEAEIELVVGFGSAPTVNTAILVWFLRAPDGTNYEDGGTSVQPLRNPDVIFTLRAATAQRITKRCKLPPGTIKALLKNDGTGQATNSSANTLKIKPITDQAAW